ncbi:hypothetical protein MKZ38_003207 [Zalerion maritima]|uniref:Cut9 interacting protein Scn1 n=1 Tax=Zalerion maritima TaxID=339359 RepID=A0AAD5WW88_9PEZI|nr:hypothetical protein MKZ38_003207 [Zalerion maritima]
MAHRTTHLDSPFPWDAGVYDAHCHPTDTMAGVKDIPAMKARGLAIMATRSQDQDLVAQVAQTHSKQDSTAMSQVDASRKLIIPAFGWHPWFSHQLRVDSTSEKVTFEQKKAHYDAVLQPTPSEKNDNGFVAGLPDPRLLSSLIDSMREKLLAHPAAMVGEIGLDKAFKLPSTAPAHPDMPTEEGVTPGGREGRRLSPYRVKMDHQVAILKAQLALAGELGRPVSVHGVQAHGVLYDSLASAWRGHEKEVISKKKLKRVAPGAEDWSCSSEEEDELDWAEDGMPVTKPKHKKEAHDKAVRRPLNLPYPPRICLHSFSGPAQVAKQYMKPTIPAEIFFSFSACINLSNQDQMQRTKAVLETIPQDKILVESDLHTAGDSMDAALEEVSRFVCSVKGWELRDGVERIGKNFTKFVHG